jgi:hypothetical protein
MRGPVSIVAGLVGAAILCQEPEFLQQYRQRLDSAIDVLQQQARDFDATAAGQSLDRAGALERLKRNADPLAAAQGTDREAAFGRLNQLRQEQAELDEPNPARRFGLLLSNLDRPVAEATLRNFVPAAPLSLEGGVFALAGLLAGMLAGFVLTSLLRALLRSPYGYRQRAPAASRR